MDKDFHYYGTYTAARLADFSVEEATTIAHSAQYVDDSSKCSERIMRIGENGLDFQPQPTCHDAMKELSWNAVPLYSKVPDEEVRRVWMSFHFLPGNYKSTHQPDPNWQSRKKDYSGPKSWGICSWTYDDHAEAQFQLLCLPRSPLAAEMVKQSWPLQSRPSNWLHMLGIRMHAYADTGAHMYYAGTPAWHVNDSGDYVYDKTVVPTREITWAYLPWLAYRLGYEACTPIGFSFESIFYLGHGRMGHLPDYPWMKYDYRPKWSSQNVTKDNPAEYIRTFLEMVLALQYERTGGGTFDYSCIDQDIETLKQRISEFLPAISDILRKNPGAANNLDDAVNKRCDLWRKELANGGRLAKLCLPSKEYDPDVWVATARSSSNELQKTDYYKFNVAAIEHANFVRKNLLADGITLADWQVKVALRAADNRHFVCAEGGGGAGVVANRDAIGAWETFNLIDLGNGNVALQAANRQYVCAEGGGGAEVVANRDAIGAWETFNLIDLGNGNVALQAANRQYVCAEGGGGAEVVANRDAIGVWETFKLIWV